MNKTKIKISTEYFLTAAGYGRKLRPPITARRVTKLCSTGRVIGAIRLARSWLIPADAKDPRFPIGKKKARAV